MEIHLTGLANSKSIFVFTDHVRSSLVRSFLSSNLSLLNGSLLSSSSGLSGDNSWGSSYDRGSKGEGSNSGSNESSNLGRVVDDVGGDSMGGLGVNMDLGDVVHLVVDLGSDMSDNRGSDNLLTDLVDRDNGLVDGVVDSGDSWGSSIGNSGSSGNSGGSNSGNSWGMSIGKSGSGSNSGNSRSSGNSGGSSVFGLHGGGGKNSSSIGSNSCKTDSSKTNSSKTTISGSDELSISISSGGGKGRGHEGRQSDEGLHCDLS